MSQCLIVYSINQELGGWLVNNLIIMAAQKYKLLWNLSELASLLIEKVLSKFVLKQIFNYEGES
ncbi:hypothetical protein NIES22_59950 [Calothrix brevissima NIES-22]|nr:hypothetical protein NIES22_59950 [Calothrix brevissima NIES-22]